jgi:hypothetical protein
MAEEIMASFEVEYHFAGNHENEERLGNVGADSQNVHVKISVGLLHVILRTQSWL